ncbi:PucR family transcriptional regulator [Yinghuangia soli]|uniref:Helix-turn-helix domain-containing protein n=1 Tax=Yinghuangia soli TaxID=2908204 RepID=A0AA41PUF1_9ACTN|nr:helix-turn-helix domain-containing protein [Yinghuangia soli]MCF2525787.1 helix-turn-helix domain-containing protein [Yinghuangia soli]
MAPVSVIGSAATRSDELVGVLLDGPPPLTGPAGSAGPIGSMGPMGPVSALGTARPSGPVTAATLLGLPEDGTYAVLALTSVFEGRTDPTSGRGYAGLAVPEPMRALWRTTGGSSVPGAGMPGASGAPGPHGAGGANVIRAHAIVLLGDGTPADLAQALDPPSGMRVGVSTPVAGPAALARARVLAERALRIDPDVPVAVLAEHLPGALIADCPDLAALLLDRALGPVLELPPADRDSLITTLRAWLESGGSTRRAGDRLFYHPNTVLNRLRRYEQLTGRLLSEPVTVVELTLALEAHRIAAAR